MVDKITNEFKNKSGSCLVSLQYAQKLCGMLQCCYYVSKSVCSLVSEISGQIAQIQAYSHSRHVLINFNKFRSLVPLILKPRDWCNDVQVGILFTDASDLDLGGCYQNGTGWHFNFSEVAVSIHINNKELLSALIGLEIS